MSGRPPSNSSQSGPNIGGIGFGIRGGGGGAARWMQGGEKPKNIKETLVRLWSFFATEKHLFFVVFFLVLCSSGIGLTVPYLIGKGVDAIEILKPSDLGRLYAVIIPLALAYVADVLLNFSNSFLMAGISQRIVRRLRFSLFTKLQKMPISYFDINTHGDLMSRFTNDIDNVSNTIAQTTTQLMSSLIMIIGSFALMITLSPYLTVASLITVPMVFTLTRTIAKRTRVLFREQQAVLGSLNGNIEETISGLDVVKVFGKEEKVIEQFEAYNSALCSVGVKAQIWSGYLMPLMNVINNIGFAAVACVGGVLAIKGYITIGVIASFLSYSKQFTRPLNDIANTFNTLQTAVAGAERVFEVLDQGEEVDETNAIGESNDIKGDVEFTDVNFGYTPEVDVLRDISFFAPRGSHIALVGPTGAGKTTIISLLTRFYDVTGGSITIDNRDIRQYRRSTLRDFFGIVLQDTYLFSGTIRDNIRYGKLDASDDEVIAAAVVANADAFIKRLPKGYDTELVESGSNLSQGQRQLISIARVVLSSPSILILDEATSSVDTRTELHIQEAMLKLMAGRTTFIIAHRLSTIRDADRILVIDKGAIVEEGTHQELLSADGVYSAMYRSQFTNDYELQNKAV